MARRKKLEFQASRAVKAMELSWAAIRRQNAEIARAVVVLASGVESRELVKAGHFSATRWRVDGDEVVAEVLVAGELLQPQVPPGFDWKEEDVGGRVLGTLLHEAVHALLHARGDPKGGTSRQGRYHNRSYALAAEEIGLGVQRGPTYGFHMTNLSEELRRVYHRQIAALERACAGFRLHIRLEREKTNTRPLYICACEPERKIRVSPKTADQGPILCGVCEHEFFFEKELAQPTR